MKMLTENELFKLLKKAAREGFEASSEVFNGEFKTNGHKNPQEIECKLDGIAASAAMKVLDKLNEIK